MKKGGERERQREGDKKEVYLEKGGREEEGRSG